MNKALREMQTLHAGWSKAEPKFFAPPQTPSRGAGWPKFNQLEMVTIVQWQGPMSVQYRPYKVFLLFLYLRDMLFKNLDDATLSPLGNPHNMQIKAAITENSVFVNISVTAHGIEIMDRQPSCVTAMVRIES